MPRVSEESNLQGRSGKAKLAVPSKTKAALLAPVWLYGGRKKAEQAHDATPIPSLLNATRAIPIGKVRVKQSCLMVQA